MNINPEPQATKLLPCPFCGKRPSLYQETPTAYWQPICCDLSGETKDEAIGNWNRRTTPAAEPPASEQWEYETTSGPRKAWSNSETPPKGDGWIRDKSRGCNGFERFDYHEESYWKRPISTPTGKESDEECATRLQPEVAASVETQNATSALVTSDAAPSGPIPEGAAMSHEVPIGEPQGRQCSTGEPQSALPGETPRTDAEWERLVKLEQEELDKGGEFDLARAVRRFARILERELTATRPNQKYAYRYFDTQAELSATRAELETANALIAKLEEEKGKK